MDGNVKDGWNMTYLYKLTDPGNTDFQGYVR